jgi:hypothetical protein
MRGIVLAGGKAAGLSPMTKAVSNKLLPGGPLRLPCAEPPNDILQMRLGGIPYGRPQRSGTGLPSQPAIMENRPKRYNETT